MLYILEYRLSVCIQEKGGFARRDELVAIQNEAQVRWAEEKLFEVDAPAEGEMCCHPYITSYMKLL